MGTRYKGTKEEILALDTYIKLIRSSESVLARTGKFINESGLSISQFGVLETLLHLGPMCQNEIGLKLLKSGGNITMVLDNLEKRGFVERKRDKSDKRFISVYLTKNGEKIISQIFPQQVKNILNEMSRLSEREQLRLGQLCKKLGKQSKEIGIDKK